MSRKGLIESAIADAKAVKEAALENAKELIIEAFTPKLKSAIAQKLSEDDQLPGYDAEGKQKREEPEGEDLSDKGDGPAVIEGDDEIVDDEEEELEIEQDDELDIEDDEEELPEQAEEDDDDLELGDEDDLETEDDEFDLEGDEDDDEVIEIVEDEEDIEDEEIPESTVIASGLKKEVAKLRKENNAYIKAIKVLQEQFKEINLFNAKLVYANKLLKLSTLNNAQKYSIVERFDSARTVREVKMVYNTLLEGIKLARKQRSVRRLPKGGSSTIQSVKSSLTESVDSDSLTRMQELAGIKQ